MRFQRETTPPPWLNRKDQYRMLGMMTMLMLIILAIDVARKPENWTWFFRMSGTPIAQEERSLENIDFRVKEGPAPLPLEHFVAVASPKTSAGPDETAGEANIRQVPARLLQGVEDQRLGRLRSEEVPLREVLKQVDRYSQQELLTAARNVGYRVINVEPEAHRGELLYVDGLLWRFAPYNIGDAEHPEQLYQAWIFTDDSSNNPWVVLLREKPADLEYGNAIDRPVKVAGYFFKRYGYPTEEGMHVAPMLIGKGLTFKPTLAVEKAETQEVTYYVVGLLAGVALFFTGIIWWFLSSDRKYRKSHTAEIARSAHDATPEVVSQMNSLPTHDPMELFRQLEQEHQQQAKDS